MSAESSIGVPSIYVKTLVGRIFGRLTVVSFAGVNDAHNALWNCICSCPAKTKCVAIGSTLIRGSKVSCGCYHNESASKRLKTHGMTGTPEHCAWLSMIARCESKNWVRHKDWGGRGITVCKRWRKSFLAFFKDMGPRPSPNHSLDRIDNSLGYFKANCAWVTARQQARNRRNNHYLELDDRKQLLMDWAAEKGLSVALVRYRLNANWTVREALETPANHYIKKPAPVKAQA